MRDDVMPGNLDDQDGPTFDGKAFLTLEKPLFRAITMDISKQLVTKGLLFDPEKSKTVMSQCKDI